MRSINSIFLKIRARITQLCEAQSSLDSDDESRGAALGSGDDADPVKKYLAFGIYRRGEQIYTEIAPNCTRRILQQGNRSGVKVADIINAEGWKQYDGLVDVNRARLYRVNALDAVNGDAVATSHKIDSFWTFAKRRLVQFNGIHKHTFYLHLKETEFRFNYRRDNLYRQLLKMLRASPL